MDECALPTAINVFMLARALFSFALLLSDTAASAVDQSSAAHRRTLYKKKRYGSVWVCKCGLLLYDICVLLLLLESFSRGWVSVSGQRDPQGPALA